MKAALRRIESSRRWKEKNREYCREYQRQYFASLSPEEKERRRESRRKYRQRTKDRINFMQRRYRVLHKTKLNEIKRRYSARPKTKALAKERRRRRTKTDIKYRLYNNCVRRISRELRKLGTSLDRKLYDFVGCSLDELKVWIEQQWLPGMTWNNWRQAGWHIDHIVAVCRFDLRDLAQCEKCFHFTNLQPLWRADNLKKGNKILV